MGRTLFVGDVHGCARELERLLDTTQPARVILLGDLFAKGPDPRGVWSLIRAWQAEAVLGNHDEEVLSTWVPGQRLPNKAHRWLRSLPITLTGRHGDRPWVAVHAGVHPRRGHRATTRQQAMHLREWKGRPWYKAYRRRRMVLHGHDARSGLVDLRPRTLCLDTACVRGGRLTGYLLEEDRIVSVRAQRAYA
jgi:predicted phosphodiesterase